MVDRRGTEPSSAAGHWDTFLQSSTCFHGWVTMANATPRRANAGSQHCQQLHLRESPLVFWIITAQTGVDRVVKTDT